MRDPRPFSAHAAEDWSRRADRGVGIDIHELLKREAFADPQPACDDHFEKNRPCPSGIYGISDQYIVLDTFLKLRESAVDRGEFRWNFMIQGVTGDEVVGVKDRIDNVIEIQIGSFSVPILQEVPYTTISSVASIAIPSNESNQIILWHNNTNEANKPPMLVSNTSPYGQYPSTVLAPSAAASPTTLSPWIHNPYTQLPFFGRFTIQLREAGLQSYSDRNGARHHYEFTLAATAGAAGTNPNMLLALPQSGSQWDTYIFTDPLKDIHGLTLVFRNPDIPICFLPDCIYDAVVEVDDGGPDNELLPASSSPITGMWPVIRINAPGHNLNMGDRIFISGFKSGYTSLDSYINRPEGLVAAGRPDDPLNAGVPISTVSTKYFWTDPAINLFNMILPAPPVFSQNTVTVCIAKRRMRIPIRLRRVVSRLTNYIAP
jgi:hypothetical protein